MPITLNSAPIVNLGYMDIDNCQISRASTTTVTIAAGQARDSQNVFDIVVSDPLTVSTAFNGANGLDTGTVANNTLYAVFVLFDPTNNVPVAGLLSTSGTEPVMPSVRGFTYSCFRRLGWVKTDSSAQIQEFYMVGNGRERIVTYNLDTTASLILGSGNATTFTAVADMADFVPSTSTRVQFNYSLLPSAASQTLTFRPTGGVIAVAFCTEVITGQVAAVAISGQFEMQTGPAQTIDYAVSAAGAAANLYIKGYTDFL